MRDRPAHIAERAPDRAAFERTSAPLERHRFSVLDRLTLRGDETVLDAGCGYGRHTKALAELLPRGHVIGIDRSAAMIAAAAQRLDEDVELIVGDLAELDLDGRRVDVVLSTGVFHWIADHDALFVRLRTVLCDGGQLVASWGAKGHAPELVAATLAVGAKEPFAPYLDGWSPWNFAGPAITAHRLRAAGFTDVRMSLARRSRPTNDLRQWLSANALSAHLPRLPEQLREPYIDAVCAEFGPNHIVTAMRLDIDATAAA